MCSGSIAALHVVEPVVAGDPLADQPALQVGERDERPCRSRRSRSRLELGRGRASPVPSSCRACVGRERLLGRDVRGGDAAVDDERRAGHERRVVGGEEQRGLGQLLGLPEPAHRDVHQPARPAGRDRRAAPRAAASRSGPGHSAFARMPWRAYSTAISRVIDEHAALARGVRDLRGRRAHQRDERRDVDDRAAARLEHRRDPGPAARATRP